MTNAIAIERLDQAIDALLHPHTDTAIPASDPELLGLLEVAADLRALPHPRFRARLRSSLLDEAYVDPLPLPVAGRVAPPPTLLGGGYGNAGAPPWNFALSLLAHAAALALLLTSGVWVAQQQNVTKQQFTDLVAPNIGDYAVARDAMHGGGGGGDRDKIAASQGFLPKSTATQITPPAVVIRNDDPRLAVEPTVVLPPTLKLPQNFPNLGDPMARVLAPPSNGPGSGSGIGSGNGGGIGAGEGVGVGPGIGGGYGGGVYRVGGGVSAPRAIYAPDPQYSDAARKARFQGTVVLWTIVGPDGRARDLRVSRSLGMGLDEKAIEAVRQWKFTPALKDGRPVAVQINIEVNFRLY